MQVAAELVIQSEDPKSSLLSLPYTKMVVKVRGGYYTCGRVSCLSIPALHRLSLLGVLLNFSKCSQLVHAQILQMALMLNKCNFCKLSARVFTNPSNGSHAQLVQARSSLNGAHAQLLCSRFSSLASMHPGNQHTNLPKMW
jgi:hypothetical protein